MKKNVYIFMLLNLFIVFLVASCGSHRSNDSGGSTTPVASGFDSTFGTNGVVSYDNGDSDVGLAITTDGSGKIYVVGNSKNTTTDMAIWRYNSDGTLDASFGNGGVVIYDGSVFDTAYGIALDGNGKILVTGYVDNPTSIDMAIWRYNSDGTPDTTFDTDGVVIVDVAGNTDYGWSIVIAANGRILVSGIGDNGTDSDAMIWGYNSDGTPDTTFGVNGVAVFDGGFNDIGFDIKLDAQGRLLQGGWTYTSTNVSDRHAAIWRYSASGVLDTTFGTNGMAVHDPSAHSLGYSLNIDGQGNIIVGGAIHNGTDWDLAIWKFGINGSPDNTFGVAGLATYASSGTAVTDFSIDSTISADGKIILVGYMSNGANMDMVLWCFNPSGTIDTSFETLGVLAVDYGGDDMLRNVYLDANGSILATGNAHNGNDYDMKLWRYIQ